MDRASDCGSALPAIEKDRKVIIFILNFPSIPSANVTTDDAAVSSLKCRAQGYRF